jgi:hypothetical protein
VGGHEANHREGHEMQFKVHTFQSAEATSGTKDKEIKILKVSGYSGYEKYKETFIYFVFRAS